MSLTNSLIAIVCGLSVFAAVGAHLRTAQIRDSIANTKARPAATEPSPVVATKCKCSGPGDCVCAPCKCEQGNECKSAYKSIVATCNAAAAGDCSCEKCECLGPKQCQVAAKKPYEPSIDVAVVCPTCRGTGRVPPPFKPVVLGEKFTEPQPAASEYMRVRVPYTVSSGFRGRRTSTAYREEWMLKSEYARRLSYQQQQRSTNYYRGGCAGGNCR